MANWYEDPTQVPAAKKKNYGGWKYDYTRKTSGPISGHPMSASIDYGPREGEWLVRRKWEGERMPGHDISAPQTRTLPASWSPTANQFPFTIRQGITSDPQRQAAFNLGLGGGRTTGMAKKAFGTYIDPQSGFTTGGGSGTSAVAVGARGGTQGTPSAQPPQYPWAQQPQQSFLPGYENWLNQRNKRFSAWQRRV